MYETELEQLLSDHRLTFNWGEPAMQWWLVGQAKDSNQLLRTKARKAANREEAQIAATQLIQEMYKK